MGWTEDFVKEERWLVVGAAKRVGVGNPRFFGEGSRHE